MYNVTISVGDAQYASNNTVNVNGVSFWTNATLGNNKFFAKTAAVRAVYDDKEPTKRSPGWRIMVDNDGAADRMTKLNYIEIADV